MSVRIGLSSLTLLLAVAVTGRAQTNSPPTNSGSGTAATGTSGDAGTVPPAVSNQQIQSLIEQLGSPKFQEREQASAQLLAIGEPALLALSAAQRGTDIEIGQRAEAIRQRIEQDQFESISQSFKRDPDPTASYGLPGWKSFSMAAGSSRPAKRLFLKMLERRRIVALCLESLDGGTVAPGMFDGLPEDPQARLRAVIGKTCGDIRFDLTTGRDEAHAGDLIALLVAERQLAEPMKDIHEAIRMECNRGGLDRLMNMPGAAPAARRTIGGWFQRAPESYAAEIFVWSNLFRIPDSAHMARRVLLANMETDFKVRALFILAKYGSADDLPLIDKFVDDTEIVADFSPKASYGDVRVDSIPPPNSQSRPVPNAEIQFRQTLGDVAMAAGAKLAGFDLHALFPAIVVEEAAGIHPLSVGFPKNEPQRRTKAVEAYKAQRTKPTPPSS